MQTHNRLQIEAQIEYTEAKLKETLASAKYNSGPVLENLRVIIPIFEDQLRLLKMILNLIPEETS